MEKAFAKRVKQEHIGWVCRTWIETPDGNKMEFNYFLTEDEANQFGQAFNSQIGGNETAREYEVYKHFTDPFEYIRG